MYTTPKGQIQSQNINVANAIKLILVTKCIGIIRSLFITKLDTTVTCQTVIRIFLVRNHWINTSLLCMKQRDTPAKSVAKTF